MMKLYHAEPAANSLKALVSFKEKGLEFESIYVDLHKFEQHEPWFIAINPEGQVFLNGELWLARSPVPAAEGDEVVVTAVKGNMLTVEKPKD